jgi:hypothetical protein
MRTKRAMPRLPSDMNRRLRRTAKYRLPARRRSAASRLARSSATSGVALLAPASPASRGPIPKRSGGAPAASGAATE